jgi:hypothetical protein
MELKRPRTVDYAQKMGLVGQLRELRDTENSFTTYSHTVSSKERDTDPTKGRPNANRSAVLIARWELLGRHASIPTSTICISSISVVRACSIVGDRRSSSTVIVGRRHSTVIHTSHMGRASSTTIVRGRARSHIIGRRRSTRVHIVRRRKSSRIHVVSRRRPSANKRTAES